MYGKIFESIYHGTLAENWKGLVTFQQMIVLCDADGFIDMTPSAISRITGIPLDIIQDGIEVLSSPDPYSRTPGSEGRRIELIDGHKPWGWHIVNHEKYKCLQDADSVRAQTRERVRRYRKAKDVTLVTDDVTLVTDDVTLVTVRNGSKRHTDTDTDTDTDTKRKETSADSKKISLSAAGAWENVGPENMLLWKKAYPAINVEAELASAAAWILANPKNRKSNYGRYITNWLKRAQDRAPRSETKKDCQSWIKEMGVI